MRCLLLSIASLFSEPRLICSAGGDGHPEGVVFLALASDRQLGIEVMATGPAGSLRADEAARLLLRELAAVPGLSPRLAEGGPIPDGSKSIQNFLPEVIIAASATGALFPSIVAIVRDWIMRQPPATTIKIKDGDFELEWSGSTPPEALEAGVNSLIARRTA